MARSCHLLSAPGQGRKVFFRNILEVFPPVLGGSLETSARKTGWDIFHLVEASFYGKEIRRNVQAQLTCRYHIYKPTTWCRSN